MKLKKFKSVEEIGEWVAPDDYFPGQELAIAGTLKCPTCNTQDWITIPYNDVTMLMALRFEMQDYPEKAGEIIHTLKEFVDNLGYFTAEEKHQFMWGFCSNDCIAIWLIANPPEDSDE
jgi:Zn ribbon nucleic-acid-binding protein